MSVFDSWTDQLRQETIDGMRQQRVDKEHEQGFDRGRDLGLTVVDGNDNVVPDPRQPKRGQVNARWFGIKPC